MVLQRFDVPPKSKVAFVDGRTLELILEVKVTVSVIASSPIVTFPLNVDVPVTVRLVAVNTLVEAL